MYDSPLYVTTTTDGRTRAAVYRDHDHDAPDGDTFGWVLRRTWERGAYRWEVIHADGVAGDARPGMAAAGQLAERLTDARRYADAYGTADPDGTAETVLSRVAVDWHTFASHVDQSGDDYLVVVTAGHLAAWGLDADTADNPARSSAAEWQAWLDGEVYTVAIERAVRWEPDADDLDARESWETVESVGGFYGDAWAEESARDMLASYAA